MADIRIKDLSVTATEAAGDDFVAFDGATNGTRKRAASAIGTVSSVGITAPAAGISVSGSPVTGSGSITLALANDLAAVEGISSTGIVRRTGGDTWSAGTQVGLTTEVTGILPVANGGTGTSSPGLVQGTNITVSGTWPNQTIASAGGSGNFLSQLTTTSVTGTSSLTTFGVMHVCTGVFFDYTVTLPTAVGNTGKIIGVQVDPGMTKLLTVAGASGQLIEGLNTRVFWKGESVVLMSNGTGWVRIGGHDRQFYGSSATSGAINVNGNTNTTLPFYTFTTCMTDYVANTTGVTPPRACTGFLIARTTVETKAATSTGLSLSISNTGGSFQGTAAPYPTASAGDTLLETVYVGAISAVLHDLKAYVVASGTWVYVSPSLQFQEISQWRA
jgi:hypothetical protein